MGYLLLVRHGLSTYNEKGLWTGWEDPPLTKKGREEAKKAASSISDVSLDYGYTSPLKRAKETLSIILNEQDINNLAIFEDVALNERNYGIYTGKNKWEVKKELGDSKFQKLRRGWDYNIPKGESLRQVYERVIPYYQQEILPKVRDEKNVLVSTSGNTIRALVKYLENISDSDIQNVEIGTGEVYKYTIDKDGTVVSKEIRAQNPQRV